MKQVPGRNEQFENIATLVAEFEATPNPIVSMDTKKKEYLGNFYRAGQLYTLAELQTYDHDFSSFAQGVVIPHGIYDLKRNQAYLNLGTSKDTSQFACDSLKQWWLEQGQFDYPQATSILILCDGGGSNSSRHHIFKQDLQSLANELGLELRIAHYPPYCSKYNPIEHRLFPHVTRACQGVIFKSSNSQYDFGLATWRHSLAFQRAVMSKIKAILSSQPWILDRIKHLDLFEARKQTIFARLQRMF